MKSSPHRGFVDSPAFVVLMGALTAFDPLSVDMYLPAFPRIRADLATSVSAVELSLSAFFVGMATGQLVYGPMADRYGRRRPLLTGMLIYLCATIGCALSTRIEMLIAFRLLQAFGGCAGMVITRAIVRDLFDKKRAAHFFSSLMLIMGLAPILAPLLGGYVSQALGWRAIFWVLGGANLLCMLAILTFLPETHENPRRDLTVRSAVRDYLALLRERTFVGYSLSDATIRAGMFAYIAGSPFVFIELFGVSAEHYGWVFGSNALGLISATQINRFLLRHRESEQILARVLPLTALVGAVLLALPLLVHSPWAVFIPLFAYIMSLGFIGPNAIACALAHQGNRAGTASALYGTVQWSLASFSSFLVSRLHDGTSLPMTGVICGCGAMSLSFFTLLVRRAPPPQTS